MKKIVFLFAIFFAVSNVKSQQAKYYLTDQAGQPWGSTSNITAMNTAFGAGNWTQGFFQSINVNALLQPSVCLIYCDGGSMAATSMNNFLVANMAALQTWVANGGRLFLNAAPNTGGNMNYGFGGTTLNYAVGPYSNPGSAVNNAHPIFVGPAAITTFTHTDNWYCHGYVTGVGLTAIIVNTVTAWSGAAPPPGAVILGSKPWGAGMCLFGSMTNTSFHAPAPSATNLRANMLTWLAVCCIQPTLDLAATSSVLCSGESTTLTASGAGAGGTYTWIAPPPAAPVVGPSVNITPTATIIYTCVGTTSTGCAGTATIQIKVNPTPTVTPSNNGPICQGSNLNLSVAAVPGGTAVAYGWMGPNNYMSGVQNPVIPNAQPNHTGIYTVTAVNSFTTGTTCQSSNTTAVGIVPVNQTTVIPSYTLCQGTNLNLSASNAVPPTSYNWTGPGGFTSALPNPSIPNVLPPVSGDYIVTASFATPGIMLVCTSTAVSNVSVVATSPVTVTVPNNICEHFTANLTASTNPTALSYDWSGPNGFGATGAATNIVGIPAAASGIYNVNATWAIGTVSCSISGYNQINVVPVPDIAINDPISVCIPNNVALTANSPGAISYNWTASTGFTSNLSSPLLASPSPSASGFYTVTTAYTNGALICYNSNTTQVTVNPILPFTLPPYKQMCFNGSYVVNGPAGATSYTWIGPNNFESNNQQLSIPSIQSGMAGQYTLTVNLGPCTTSANTSVDVLTPIAFAKTPDNKVICAGDKVDLVMESTGGSMNYAYTWNPQIYLPSPTGSVQAGVQPEGTIVYNVAAYDITCPNYTISTAFTVTVNKAPTPVLDLAATEGCQPLCLNFNSQTQDAADLIVYDFGNGKSVQKDNFEYCLSEPGTYNVRIRTRGKNGCNGMFTHPVPIHVWPTPHTDLRWTPDPATTTQNQITFNPDAQYGPVVRYQWQFQGASGASGYDTSALRNPMRVYENVGKYPVMVVSTTDKGCIDTTFRVIEIRDEFTIFIPNTFTPNGDGLNDVFNIKGLGLKAEGYSMEIYDRWGALLYATKDALKGWDGTVKGLNAENGVYVYKVIALGANGEGKKEYVGHVSLLR